MIGEIVLLKLDRDGKFRKNANTSSCRIVKEGAKFTRVDLIVEG